MIREILKMLNQYSVDNPTLLVNLRFSHLFKILAECEAVLEECRAATMRWQVFGTRMVYRETFLWIQPRLLQHLIRKSPILWVDQQRLQISDLHFDKFTTPATFACWKIRFKTEVCTCSQFLTEAMLWIKEVELVDSVDDLKSSCSVRGIRMPDFEVLDAKIASALNRIIHNTRFKRRISLEEKKAQKQDRFLRETDCLPDLRVLPGHWSQRFCRELCRPVYNCSSKWWYSGILFEMGRNFIINDANPIWRKLGRIVQIKNTRVWETQDRIGNCTICLFIRRKLDLMITDWREWWKEVSSRINELRILKPETEIMRHTPWSRIRGQNRVNKEL